MNRRGLLTMIGAAGMMALWMPKLPEAANDVLLLRDDEWLDGATIIWPQRVIVIGSNWKVTRCRFVIPSDAHAHFCFVVEPERLLQIPAALVVAKGSTHGEISHCDSNSDPNIISGLGRLNYEEMHGRSAFQVETGRLLIPHARPIA